MLQVSEMATRSSLSKKLARVGQVEKIRNAEMSSIPDIEDAVPMRSPYFSPIQTRHQRKRTWNPPQKYELPPKKSPIKTEPEVKVNGRKKQEHSHRNRLSSSSSDDDNDGSEYTPKWEPSYWRDVLDNIRKMRSENNAPVDTMGCHKCSDENADEKTQRFQKLVALMLSSQTKDEITYQAMQRLKARTLTPESIVAMTDTELEDLLHPVSFFRNKAKYLRQAARILIDEYESDIPFTITDLIALPGVGPKMAHICMATAWQEITGIGVDVHVHRISNRLRWTPKETKDPEKTRLALEEWLPRELWGEVNHLLVGFGQTVCTPMRPHCGDCLNRDLCPSAFKNASKKATPSTGEDATATIRTKSIKAKKATKKSATTNNNNNNNNNNGDSGTNTATATVPAIGVEVNKPNSKGKKLHL